MIANSPASDEAEEGNGKKPMKLGLLAYIHEQTAQLRTAINRLQQHGAEAIRRPLDDLSHWPH